ncbi:MAG: glycosyltransferase [Aeriscardovia sp.]|nr:glycosyltransferase [Aeriscardovia sp.]
MKNTASLLLPSSEPLVSIIMPVYNVSQWLDQSLHCAVTQTHRNLEIIVVDDGSTDRSGEIADDWARLDNRLRVLHLPNNGVSAARNAGLAAAQGDYTYFFDPDDLITPNLVEMCLAVMRRQDADLVMFKFDTISANSMPIVSHYSHNKYSTMQVFTPREAIKKQLKGQIGGYLWSFVTRTSVYREGNISFPEGRVIEDTARICQIFGETRRIVRLPAVLYHYRLHSGSLMSKPGLLADWKKATTDRKQYVVETFPDLRTYARIQQLSPSNIDYESLRQNLLFNLKLDTDSVERRATSRFERREARRTLREERNADKAISKAAAKEVRKLDKAARKAGKELGTVDWADVPSDADFEEEKREVAQAQAAAINSAATNAEIGVKFNTSRADES